MKKLRELMIKTRSCRRFEQEAAVDDATLRELIELARFGGSARNLQPLKYLPVNDPEINAGIFPLLGWAGYLPEWPGPEEGERPSAYIICLLDTSICDEAGCDLGIATQNILLGATAKGLGGCRIGSFSPEMHELLGLARHHKILLVLALGRPREQVVLDEAGAGGSIRYWRDENKIHHVPKRPLDEIVVF
jgi:nitroreductase